MSKPKNKEKRPNMLLYLEHLNAFMPVLKLEDRGALLTALYEYYTTGTATEPTDPTANAAYKIMSAALDRNTAYYRAKISEARSEAGARGGHASGETRRRKALLKQTEANDDIAETPSSLKFQGKETIQNEANEANEAICNHIPNHNPNHSPNHNTYTEGGVELAPQGSARVLIHSDTPPTLEEVTEYFRQEGIMTADPIAFYEYNQARGWQLSGGVPVMDWKPLVRKWLNTCRL